MSALDSARIAAMTMQAIRCRTPGGPEVLEQVTLPVPLPGPGQVLIEVHAAGVNRPDIAQRRGTYPVPADADPTLGLEVAGVVRAGPDALVGRRVAALVHGGGYAEWAVAPAAQLLLLPDEVGFVEGAALPEVAMTVEYNLIERAALRPGESVLIHGGSSGIGSHAIQRARAVGARVFATAGSEDKCAWCRDLGAEAINYRQQDFVAAVLAATGGRGVDVVLDMVGGDYTGRNLRAMAPDGRCAVISLQGGAVVTVDLEPLLRRRLMLVGATLRPLPAPEKARIAAQVRAAVLPLVAAGAIRSTVTAVLPLGAVAQAHRLLESGGHMGKIVLRLR